MLIRIAGRGREGGRAEAGGEEGGDDGGPLGGGQFGWAEGREVVEHGASPGAFGQSSRPSQGITPSGRAVTEFSE